MNRFITTVALAVVTLPALSAPTVQTLTGVVKGGTADSCLNVGAGKDEKCYSFGSRSSIAACKEDDACTVTGRFDDDKEQLVSVEKAVKVKPCPGFRVEHLC